MESKIQPDTALPLQISEFSGPSNAELTTLTIGQYFKKVVDNYADNPAIIVKHQSVHWTYQQYWREVERVACGLLANGVEPGDRVGIWSPNNIEWSLVQMATARIGAIMVCLNPAYRPDELAFAINNVGVKHLVMAQSFKQSNYIAILKELAPELDTGGQSQTDAALSLSKLPSLKHVYTIGETHEDGLQAFSKLQIEPTDALRSQLSAIETTLNADDNINIQFTSGTTGNPKGATLTHRNILNNGLLVSEAMRFTHKDKLCIPVPLYHCFGMVLGNLVCLASGACAVFPGDSFDPETTLRTVEQEKCTGLHGVPTMFIAELELPNFRSFDLSSLRTGVMAGSTCPEELMRKVHSAFHMTEVVIGYGQTECSPINHITDIDSPFEKQVKTVGRAMPHTEVKIIDAQGNTVPIGEPGEICARGYCVMKGYWGDKAKTKATIDNEGWLHSGDLGEMDEEGYVTIVGRIKDMIIRGGENIYPREIEEVLYQHDDVSDAAVFGIPDDKYGEQVCLWIKAKENRHIDEEQIRDYLKSKLAYFKVPKYISVVKEYPMTVTGKLQKFKMREHMIETLKKQTLETEA
ncbi:AMP-binding protein [Alteromonas sp. BL110]|uniref:AMP-binding protein n=1 Tax=Alteromonas sp. BL110 TaxID=1714845 RepID=UPI000E511985|nr:AMP-binding protein [Alteromonas sp. BL110]AXT39174.1 AMP-binding protein [Alteromonas sp. BL110]RKM82343.1 AMP-binding protein [Alteromonas sp. BL110]